jgi:hypothetical protein
VIISFERTNVGRAGSCPVESESREGASKELRGRRERTAAEMQVL